MLIISLVLLPIALVFMAFTLYGFMLNHQSNIKKRLYGLQGSQSTAQKVKKQLKNKDKKTNPFDALIYETMRIFSKLNISMTRKEIILLNILCAAIIFTIAHLGLKQLALSIILAPVGFFLPLLLGRNIIKAKQKAFDNLFGDAMVLIANVLKSGFSIKQAFQIVAEEMPAAVADEFAILNKEISYGLDMNEAMRNLVERMPNEYVQLFVTAVNIQSEVGGSMAEIIGKIAETIQEKQTMSGELKALTAQGKSSGVIVGILPFAIMGILSLINPEYMAPLYTTPIGWVMLGMTGILEIAAIFVIKMITTVE